MKKLLLLFALSTLLFVNSINIKTGSKAPQIAQDEWNDDNKLIEIEYQHNDNFIVEYSEFVNSYGKEAREYLRGLNESTTSVL